MAQDPLEGIGDGVELRRRIAGRRDAADGDQAGCGGDANFGIGRRDGAGHVRAVALRVKSIGDVGIGRGAGGIADGVEPGGEVVGQVRVRGENARVDHGHAHAASIHPGKGRVGAQRRELRDVGRRTEQGANFERLTTTGPQPARRQTTHEKNPLSQARANPLARPPDPPVRPPRRAVYPGGQ